MRYICQICGYVYDDAKEKVPFSSLPDTWRCPLCGAAKSDFKPEEVKKAEAKAPTATYEDEELQKLSNGQMSALFSNLARGAEKQYKGEEAKMFKELADYFASVTPIGNDAVIENIVQGTKKDLENYPVLRTIADAYSDRGAARVCVWGEKVTNMIASLLNRYQTEGEKMLENTNVWVCSVCGFIYIGENPPKLCPVCKVPDWKFDKIEGRV